MKVRKLIIIALILFCFYSCGDNKKQGGAKIVASFVSITPKVFQQFSEDTVKILVSYSDARNAASYVILSDSRWDSIPPRFITFPNIPKDIDTRFGNSGVMELQVPMDEIRVLDPTLNRETFAYRLIVIGVDSAVNSSDYVWTDSITVTR